jgi:hypothetical protein
VSSTEARATLATRSPWGYRVASHEATLDSSSLFDPEFTPARRTDFAVDQGAGVRLLLIALALAYFYYEDAGALALTMA